MSKIYQKYLSLKNSKNYTDNTLYLFKSGIFFIFVDEDAKKMSQVLGLKLGKLNEDIVKCGFPIHSLEKYMQLLASTPYHVEIASTDSQDPFSSQTYLQNESIRQIVHKILQTNIDTLSISESYDFLYEIQNKFNEVVRGNKN